MAHGFTDKDGDYFEASHIGEGMMRLRAVYGAKAAERVDVDFLADDLDSIVRILQLAADAEAAKCPPRTEGATPHCPDCSGIVGETGIVR